MTIKTSGLLHTHHVAEMLACSDRHVRNLIKSGALEAVRVSKRCYRVRRESVILFLEQSKVEPENFFI